MKRTLRALVATVLLLLVYSGLAGLLVVGQDKAPATPQKSVCCLVV